MTYGDNNKGKILGSRDIGDKDSLIIKYVLLVEGLKHNLLSICQLCNKGLQVTFEPKSCLVSNLDSRKILLVGKRMNNVYILNISYINSIVNCLMSKSDESWLWHRHILHIHMHHLNNLVSKDLANGLPKLKF